MAHLPLIQLNKNNNNWSQIFWKDHYHYTSAHLHEGYDKYKFKNFFNKYSSPYRHISQFRIHEISFSHTSFLAKYFKLYYSYRHIGTTNSVIIPILDREWQFPHFIKVYSLYLAKFCHCALKHLRITIWACTTCHINWIIFVILSLLWNIRHVHSMCC